MNQNMMNNKLYDLKSVFTTTDAAQAGFTKYTLHQLVSSGKIHQLGSGQSGVTIWANDTYLFDRRAAIQLQYPQAVLSGVAALTWWDLLDRQDRFIDLTVPKGYQVRNLKQDKTITLHHVIPQLYPIGLVMTTKPDDNFPMKVYSPERALIDVWRFQDSLSISDRDEATRHYFESDFYNPQRLKTYLNQFPGLKALNNIVEVSN